MRLPAFSREWRTPPSFLSRRGAQQYLHVLRRLAAMRYARPPVTREMLVQHAVAYDEWLNGDIGRERDALALLETIEEFASGQAPIAAVEAGPLRLVGG